MTWSEDDKTRLRQMLADGKTGAECAEALGRSESAISSFVNRVNLNSFKRIPAMTQARIRDLAVEGWQASRIARRLQIPVEVVERYSVPA